MEEPHAFSDLGSFGLSSHGINLGHLPGNLCQWAWCGDGALQTGQTVVGMALLLLEGFYAMTDPAEDPIVYAIDFDEDLLDAFHYRADRVITNPFGERVWLKSCDGGVTDCCPVEAPCTYHARLTHSAPARLQ